MSPADRIQKYFTEWIATHGSAGPHGELARWLATGEIEPSQYPEIVARHGVDRVPGFRDGVLDMVMSYAERCFVDGPPSVRDVAEIRILRRALHVADATLSDRRPVELSLILRSVFEAVLADGVIEDWEDLYLVEVQAAFGIGYDELLSLARPALEEAVANLERRLAAEPRLGDRRLAAAKLAALEPMYRLAAARPPSLGRLH
jgi:hypothetical protein